MTKLHVAIDLTDIEQVQNLFAAKDTEIEALQAELTIIKSWAQQAYAALYASTQHINIGVDVVKDAPAIVRGEEVGES